MKQQLMNYLNILSDKISERVISSLANNGTLADNISYRISLENLLSNNKGQHKTPYELFNGISDDYWFWLNTEGYRRMSVLSDILPGLPDEFIQEMFTGDKGDGTLKDGFNSYRIFKEQYEKHKGPINEAGKILDFGCGWGRIIRFFLKDLTHSKVWGCDPVPDMIKTCQEQNKWGNFVLINTFPPTTFEENSFDLIYSFSVFSHLSEDLHLQLIQEINRILTPGGIFIATTRNRGFIKFCDDMRKQQNINNLNPGPKSSTTAFPNTQQSQLDYDQGKYCHHSFNDVNWPFWGETAIPKEYVLGHWSKHFTFLDFIDDEKKCPQNVIVVQKPI